MRCKMSAPFWGKAVVIGRSSGPPGSGSLTIVSASAGEASAKVATPAVLRKRRRDDRKREGLPAPRLYLPTAFGLCVGIPIYPKMAFASLLWLCHLVFSTHAVKPAAGLPVLTARAPQAAMPRRREAATRSALGGGHARGALSVRSTSSTGNI